MKPRSQIEAHLGYVIGTEVRFYICEQCHDSVWMDIVSVLSGCFESAVEEQLIETMESYCYQF